MLADSSRLLVLSPHLDDAAFSIGPLLASRRGPTRVATPFAASQHPAKGFALQCQTDKGIPPETDYMALRRGEDVAWARHFPGLEIVHGPFVEAPHRGYESAAALFGARLATDSLAELSNWMDQQVREFQPTRLAIPLAIGGHVDHLHVHEKALAGAIQQGLPAWGFADQPYHFKSSHDGTPAMELPGATPWVLEISESSLTLAIEAATAYTSQLAFQFGSVAACREILRSAWGQRFAMVPLNSAAEQSNHLPSAVP